MRRAFLLSRIGQPSLLLVAMFSVGCREAGSMESAGVSVRPPEGWTPVEPTRWYVPGRALAAWSGPEGSSLVVYRTLPIPDGTGASIAESLANRLLNLPGLSVMARETREFAGQTAGWVEVVAPGVGSSLAPSGAGTPVAPEGQTLQPTRQVTAGFARPGGAVYLTWHVPEAAHDRLAPQIASTLGGLRFDSAGSTKSY